MRFQIIGIGKCLCAFVAAKVYCLYSGFTRIDVFDALARQQHKVDNLFVGFFGVLVNDRIKLLVVGLAQVFNETVSIGMEIDRMDVKQNSWQLTLASDWLDNHILGSCRQTNRDG